MTKNNIRVTRCYLVEYVDDNGVEIVSDFCFGTKEDAFLKGERMKSKATAESKPKE